MLLPCTVTQNITFTSDVTLPDGTSMMIVPGVVVTLNGVTLDLDKKANLTIESGGGLKIISGGALNLSTRGP